MCKQMLFLLRSVQRFGFDKSAAGQSANGVTVCPAFHARAARIACSSAVHCTSCTSKTKGPIVKDDLLLDRRRLAVFCFVVRLAP